MMIDERRNIGRWLEEKPLVEIIRQHYTIPGSSKIFGTIDLNLFLRGMKRIIEQVKRPLSLNLRGISQLPIERGDLCKIYEVALKLLLGRDGRQEVMELFSQNGENESPFHLCKNEVELEEWQELLVTAGMIASLQLNDDHLKAILTRIKRIPLKERSGIARDMVRFYDSYFPGERGSAEWKMANPVRLFFIFSSLDQLERDSILKEGAPLLRYQCTALPAFDILRFFSPAERKTFVARVAALLAGWELSEPVIADRLLSYLFTVPSEKREFFLTKVEEIVSLTESMLIGDKKAFIDRMVNAMQLHMPEGEVHFFASMNECLQEGSSTLERMIEQPYDDRYLWEGAVPHLIEPALSLMDRCEKGHLPPETARLIALELLPYVEGTEQLLDEEHPLAEWVLLVQSINDPDTITHPQNPYMIYFDLQQVRAKERVVTLQKEEMATFEVEIAATGERYSCQWNLEGMRALSGRVGLPSLQQGDGINYKATAIPEGVSHTTLLECYGPMRERLSTLESEIEKRSGLTSAQFQAFVQDPFIQGLCRQLDPCLSRERTLPRDVLQLSCILKKMSDSSSEIPAGELLSPREELFITLAASVRHCPTGKSNAIDDFYHNLDPSYRRLIVGERVEDFLNSLLQKALHNLFTKKTLLQELVCAEAIAEDTHVTRFLKNRLGAHLGLQQSLEFDFYTQMLPKAILDYFQQPGSVEKAVKLFLHHLSIDDFLLFSGAKASQKLLDQMRESDSMISQSLLMELKTLSQSVKQPLFGYKNFAHTSHMIARGLGHTEVDHYELTIEESERIFHLYEGEHGEEIIPLTEEALLRMLFATICTRMKDGSNAI